MANDIKIFQENFPSLASYWRSIILFGKNVASYKFSLAKSLLEIAPKNITAITLEELAVPFSKHICEHIVNAPKQATSISSQFLDACRNFNNNNISQQQLVDITVQKGFNNVLDAFHIVNDEALPLSFFEKEYSRGNKKIILSDEIFKLQETPFYNSFTKETEARWNLVETAWELGLSRNLLNVQYDINDNLLFISNKKLRRKNVTSARDALNGYQKGKCFYCLDDISLSPLDNSLCDVDHFFPHLLQSAYCDINFNGVWNLTLSCNKCNRGLDGKFAKAPATKYLARLHKRNEFLINSHHPLSETLINQTGSTTSKRIEFLKKVDSLAINILIHRWEVPLVGEEIF